MNLIKNILLIPKLNIVFFILSLIYFFFINTFYGNFFNNGIPISYLPFQVVSLVLSVLFFQSLASLYYKLKNNDEFSKNFLKSFFIVGGVNIIFFILCYPGVFCGDEYSIVNCILDKYCIYSSHLIYTEFYYLIAYLIFPFLSGVVLFQIIIYSIISSYLYAKIIHKNNYKYSWLVIMPFILPPLIRMNMQGLRSSIYYIFLILFYALIYFKYKEKTDISYREIILLSILSIPLAIFRPENVILLVLFPISLKFVFANYLTLKKLFVYLLLFILSCIFIAYITDKNIYNNALLPIIRPLTVILQTDFKSNDKTADLNELSKFINVEDYINTDVNYAIFLNSYKKEFLSKNDQKSVFKVSLKLIIYNFDTYLKDRLLMYKNYAIDNSSVYILRDDYKTNIIPSLNILEGRTKGRDGSLIAHIMYNIYFPFLLLFVLNLIALIKRNKVIFSITFISLSLYSISYLTSAESYFHYFLQGYLLVYLILSVLLVKFLNKDL